MKLTKDKLLSLGAGIPKGLVWAIGDPHGCAQTLKALYNKLNNPTAVYITGDYIDRGPDTKGVIDFVMAHKNIIPLMGNHEDVFLMAYDDPDDEVKMKAFIKRGGKEMLDSFNIDDIRDMPKKYVKWIRKLPLVAKYKKFRLSHAGTDHNSEKPLRNTEKNRKYILWNRKVQAPTNGLRIVIGHTPTALAAIKKSAKTAKVMIDGGCVYGGVLVAFCLDTEEIVTQKNIDQVASHKQGT